MVQFLESLPMINLKPNFSQKEKRIVILYSIFLILLVVLLPFYGVLTTPKGKFFTWAPFRQSLDYNAYQTWVTQFSQGKFLAEILYTTERHPALFFHPLFFLAGQINLFLKIPLEIIFIIFSLLANFFLLITLYYFVSHFLKSFSSRLISFIFISLGSGLGWLSGPTSADLFLFEITFLRILCWPFIMSLGLAFLLWSLLFFIKSFKEKGQKKAFLAGFSAFLLVLIHPYDIVIFYTLAFSYLIFFTKFWSHLIKILIVFLFPLPVIVYYFLVKYSHFVWYQHSLAPMFSPPLLSYFLGLFNFILLALFSLKRVYKKELQILFLWSIVYFLLLYLPVTFQWKLSLGIFIPLGILAGSSLDNFYRFLNKKFPQISPGLLFLLIVLVFSSLTNISVFEANIRTFRKGEYPYYLDREIKDGFEWLKENTLPEEVIFSSFEIGSFIPRYSSRKVFIGHWAQTIFAKEKNELVKNFFISKINEEEVKSIFKTHQIKYIFYSDFEKKIGQIDLSKFGQEVFKNNKVSIFKINL